MKTCQMVIGRLVSHPCGSKAAGRCGACGRPMCAHHLVVAQQRCTQCLGQYAPVAAPLQVSEEEMMHFDAAEIAAFDQAGPAQPLYHGDS